MSWELPGADPLADLRAARRMFSGSFGQEPTVMQMSERMYREPQRWVFEPDPRRWRLWRRVRVFGCWCRVGGEPLGMSLADVEAGALVSVAIGAERSTPLREVRGWRRARAIRRLYAQLETERPEDRQ